MVTDAKSSGAMPSQFVMTGAREVVRRGVAHMEEHVLAIEQNLAVRPTYVFDLSRTIMEAACRTILKERGCKYGDSWELPKLFKETTNLLRLVPDDVASDATASASLRKTLGGIQGMVHGVCELRKAHGWVAHGRDGTAANFDALQAMLVARAADMFVSYLFGAHFDYAAPLAAPVMYADNPAFNDSVDEAHELVRIFELEYRPSEVLYHVDNRAYMNFLQGYEGDEASEDDEAESTETAAETVE